ncbi:CSS-motif domain-containing protein, partial [Chromobacterium amazonense]|uniref:CSS-motif domain-containing protein n=1 Tax=Chromobacterium amazonense TaxID=1382803 RepID=UPI003F7AD37A
MNPLHPRRQHRVSHLLASLLVSALPLLAIIPTLIWQEKQDLRRQAEYQVAEAVALMEEILEQAERASRAILPLAGRRCEDAVPELRRQATIVPFVRSTGLLRDNAIYCSSLFGAISHPKPNSTPFVGGTLRLLPGNLTTPDVPVLHFRQSGAKGDVLAAVDGRYLQLALRDASEDAPVYLIIGDRWLSAHQTGRGSPPHPTEIQAIQHSARYPLSVSTGYHMPSSHH